MNYIILWSCVKITLIDSIDDLAKFYTYYPYISIPIGVCVTLTLWKPLASMIFFLNYRIDQNIILQFIERLKISNQY